MMTTLKQPLPRFINTVIFTLLVICTLPTQAQDVVQVDHAWAGETHAGQTVGAAYMNFLSKQDITLTHVESDLAKTVEIHSMSMENNIMKMRMLESLPIHAGKTAKLAPGGLHLMLFDLTKPLSQGDILHLTLTFSTKDRSTFKQTLKVPVKRISNEHGDHSHHHH
ncbi:MAG: copper chaperone PCu(A)C [Methylotenera sp.]|nr:copper chaperone PCu(A)C [Methylotenera sp.]